jgi:AraC-like DNA-binding protein
MDLLKTGMDLRSAAREVGYGSYEAFARQFELRVGCSPRQWLRIPTMPPTHSDLIAPTIPI